MKNSSSEFIIGTCNQMCPDVEVNMRKKNNLIHFFEQKNGKFVKEFSRSAADKKIEKFYQLRTFKALEETIKYLFTIILRDPQKPLNFRYDFIFDRCRAIRQEIVMQNFTCEETIMLMEPIVMFHSYSLYQLNGLPISLFDSKICRQHLQECLQKCLTCYEEIDASGNGNYKIQNRIVIEAIYLMLNLNDFSALQHILKLDSKLKSSFTLKIAIKISICFHQKNFHKLLHDIQDLPHLIGAIGSLNLSPIRKEVFRIFSIAYNSQSLKVPIEFLQRLLIYDQKSSLISHLCDLGIYKEENCKEITAVVFNRKNFDYSKNISNTPQHFVDQKLCDFHLPDLILMKTI